MQVPPNSFNQVIQQALQNQVLTRIGIEEETTFGSDGGMKEFARNRVADIEYIDGVLVIWAFQVLEDGMKLLTTEMIPWGRIRRIYWDGPNVPSRILFPETPQTQFSQL